MKKNEQNVNNIYMTVLTNSNYLGGVRILNKSLKQVNAQYPLVVLMPAGIDIEIQRQLDKENILYILSDGFDESVFSRANKVSHWRETFFKLKVFDQTDFRKIVFLDADMIVNRNIDHLFGKPHMACVAAGQELHADWINLNSGLMVIEPSHQEYSDMLQLIEPVFAEKESLSQGVGDQDIITAYYDNWRDSQELHLPGSYNVMLGYAGYLKRNGTIVSVDDIYVYHYTGYEKPWRNIASGDVKILLKILKRSKSWIDFQMFMKYKRMLKSLC